MILNIDDVDSVYPANITIMKPSRKHNIFGVVVQGKGASS
jgi:hypothetical protein